MLLPMFKFKLTDTIKLADIIAISQYCYTFMHKTNNLQLIVLIVQACCSLMSICMGD